MPFVEVHDSQLPPCTSNTSTAFTLDAANALKAGSTVWIVGLKGQPELNGRKGVCGAFDQAAGRWEVRLHASVINYVERNLEVKLPNERAVKVRPTHPQANLEPTNPFTAFRRTS